ncbi:MAG: DUF3303 family protein [Actinomycetota bacterium]
MLFYVKQVHTPDHCPSNREERPESLLNTKAEGLKVHLALVDATRHTMHFAVETDDIQAVREFLAPGITHCTTEINPVTELPAFARG